MALAISYSEWSMLLQPCRGSWLHRWIYWATKIFKQDTTVNDKLTAGRFNPKVFVNCVQDKKWGEKWLLIAKIWVLSKPRQDMVGGEKGTPGGSLKHVQEVWYPVNNSGTAVPRGTHWFQGVCRSVSEEESWCLGGWCWETGIHCKKTPLCSVCCVLSWVMTQMKVHLEENSNRWGTVYTFGKQPFTITFSHPS